jgi:hypothetical protein
MIFCVEKCFSEGQVKNFGVPRELLNDKTSVLYDLTRKLPANEKKLIYDTANAKKIVYVKQHNDRKISMSTPNNYSYENKAVIYD